ncbi:MAG: alpha/beta hydrolase [Gammaproteobacteria bacterium]|jgi:hypothetical protein
MKPLVIIHGWSDEAESFRPLADAIEQSTDRSVENLYLGNYVSLDDDVQMADLVQGLARAWKQQRLPEESRGADVIIHSTGGLIVRDWLDSEYAIRSLKPPVNNLIMLAPANIGSPLAHKGRAFYGRVFKGFKSKKRFNTGTHILKALEMASPYSWRLAERDRFTNNLFSATGVRTTVIVGNTGYKGIKSIANEPGSDGTVYVSTANLNCARVDIHFPSGDRKPKVKAIKDSKGKTAFLVVDDCTHSTVAYKDDNATARKSVLNAIVEALGITNAEDFDRWVDACTSNTNKVMKKYAEESRDYKHGFQNTVFHVHDDQGFEVQDYVLEFYHDTDAGDKDELAEDFNKKAIRKVHAYGDNAAFRSFLINTDRLNEVLNKHNKNLCISLSAMPDLGDDNNLVGYRTFGDQDIGEMVLTPAQVREFFQPNRTLFVDITLTREQKDELFWIRNRADLE